VVSLITREPEFAEGIARIVDQPMSL